MGLIDIKDVGGIVSGIGETAIKIRQAITGIDPAKQTELNSLLANLESQANNAQVELNKTESNSNSLFKSSWRPFIGWSCGFSFAYNFLMLPLLNGLFALLKVSVILSPLDMTVMLPVLLGMLGLGSMRTYEKYKGVK
jgi:hypothetical protein